MRPRTPTIIWIPFLFSVTTVSWVLLIAGLAVLALVVLARPLEQTRQALILRNDLQATVKLLDQQVAQNKEFVAAAQNDVLVQERLAARQLNYQRPGQQVLPLVTVSGADRSVAGLLRESLLPVTPEAVAPLPWYFKPALDPALRPLLLVGALIALFLAFLLGVRYDRSAPRVLPVIPESPTPVPSDNPPQQA